MHAVCAGSGAALGCKGFIYVYICGDGGVFTTAVLPLTIKYTGG